MPASKAEKTSGWRHDWRERGFARCEVIVRQADAARVKRFFKLLRESQEQGDDQEPVLGTAPADLVEEARALFEQTLLRLRLRAGTRNGATPRRRPDPDGHGVAIGADGASLAPIRDRATAQGTDRERAIHARSSRIGLRDPNRPTGRVAGEGQPKEES